MQQKLEPINLFREVPYSFTFTIPVKKKVYYDGRRRIYSQMSNSSQAVFINQLMTKIIWTEHFKYIDYVFEKHEPSEYDKLGRLHIHGYAIVKKQYDNLQPVHLLADSFYTHNKIIGLANSVYPRLMNIQQTREDISWWLDYMNKHQHKISFQNSYHSQQFLINSIDNPNFNITTEKIEVEI